MLKEFKGRGKARSWVAYYYGYREKYARLKVFPDAFNEAISQIRPEIQADIAQLRRKLLERAQ